MIRDRFGGIQIGFALLLFAKAAHGEVIDGPANIRSAPNGSISFLMLDGKQVEIDVPKGEWVPVRVKVEQPLNTTDKRAILPGQVIFCGGSVECGKATTAVVIDNAQVASKGIISGTIRGYTHVTNLKRIKLVVPPTLRIDDGYYLVPSLVNEKKKVYSVQGVWDAPPFPAEASLKKLDNKLHISVGDLHERVIDFQVAKNGVVDNPTCAGGNMCVSEVNIPSRSVIFIVIHGVKHKFVNVRGMKEVDHL